MLPRRCIGRSAFILEFDPDQGLVTGGAWSQQDNAVNQRDCASLDEFSLYSHTGSLHGADKDSGRHNYLGFAEGYLQKFGGAGRVLEVRQIFQFHDCHQS